MSVSRSIGRLVDRLRGIYRGELAEKLKKQLAAEALSQVAKGFRQSRDPYGAAWAALKRRSGKPLLDTGRLRNSFSSSTTPQGFKVGSNVKYAGIHQNGATYNKGSKSGVRAVRVPLKRGRKQNKKRAVAILFVSTGRRVLPSRKMVPTSSRLGPIWRDGFKRVFERAIAKHMKEG